MMNIWNVVSETVTKVWFCYEYNCYEMIYNTEDIKTSLKSEGTQGSIYVQ